jgi:hypothetical protein
MFQEGLILGVRRGPAVGPLSEPTINIPKAKVRVRNGTVAYQASANHAAGHHGNYVAQCGIGENMNVLSEARPHFSPINLDFDPTSHSFASVCDLATS